MGKSLKVCICVASLLRQFLIVPLWGRTEACDCKPEQRTSKEWARSSQMSVRTKSIQRCLLTADLDSMRLQWGLRVCVPSKLPRRAKAVVLLSHSGQPTLRMAGQASFCWRHKVRAGTPELPPKDLFWAAFPYCPNSAGYFLICATPLCSNLYGCDNHTDLYLHVCLLEYELLQYETQSHSSSDQGHLEQFWVSGRHSTDIYWIKEKLTD